MNPFLIFLRHLRNILLASKHSRQHVIIMWVQSYPLFFSRMKYQVLPSDKTEAINFVYRNFIIS